MIIATLEAWQDGHDEPVRKFNQVFPSKDDLRLWLREQKQQMGFPYMWYILVGTEEVPDE